MPWELTITKKTASGETPLGRREEVRTAFSSAYPGIELELPPVPPKELLETFPPIIRESFANPDLTALVEIGGCSFEFSCLNSEEIEWIHVDVRGNGDPLPTLAALCGPNGWTVRDALNKEVDLSERSPSAWHQYCVWRDKALQSLRQNRETWDNSTDTLA